MIPLKLEIENFMSYRRPVVLDLSGVHLACIAGENGAGKSSLLDAITWALFGKCRAPGRDDVINRQAVPHGDAARVLLDMSLEGDLYRVLRVQAPDKTGVLEFHLATAEDEWKSLTESSQTRTQSRIEELLRMSYETFTNASFLLQGRADEFTVKRPGERKRILGDLLGVSHWELYRQEAGNRRGDQQQALRAIDERLKEIETNLSQGPALKSRLDDARTRHAVARRQRETQEKLVQSIRAYTAAVEQHQALLNTLSTNLDVGRASLQRLSETRVERQVEWERSHQVIARAASIEKRHADWQQAVVELQSWETKAVEWNRLTQQRLSAHHEIERERSRLEQETAGLRTRQADVAAQDERRAALRKELEQTVERLAELRAQMVQREPLVARQGELQTENGRLQSEQTALKEEMAKLDARRVQLQTEEGGRCPLCDQPLTPEHRAEVITQVETEGTRLGDQFRDNKAQLADLQRELEQNRAQIRALNQLEPTLRAAERAETSTQTQIKEIKGMQAEWTATGRSRLATLEPKLAAGDFAAQAQTLVAEYDAALAQLNYDGEAHATGRQRAAKLADAQSEYQRLGEGARRHQASRGKSGRPRSADCTAGHPGGDALGRARPGAKDAGKNGPHPGSLVTIG